MLKMKKDAAEPFTIPSSSPAAVLVRAISNRWLGLRRSCRSLSWCCPRCACPHELLNLRPRRAAANPAVISSFSHFNPVQTQVFHSVFHWNILLAPPARQAELAVLRLLRPGNKASTSRRSRRSCASVWAGATSSSEARLQAAGAHDVRPTRIL